MQALARLFAIALKEVQQMLRDKLTFAMAVGVPILQLVLFGYAINTDPKGLPTAIVSQDTSPMARSLVAALQTSGYFRVAATGLSEARGDELLQRGEVQFLVVVPDDFGARVVRGVLASRAPQPAPFEVRIQRRYNPEGLSRYNIVPGLVGTILTMTMVMLTALAMTRERERGTMENLLATPVRPFEVMAGKILPYVVLGYVQLGVILGAAFLLFDVPMVGSLPLLLAMIGVFMLANLGVGFTFSTLARNQLQALQLTFFFFLPSMLLSGFMFPFRGMPPWAQSLGEALPLTHFLRIVRGVMLKGSGSAELLPELWPMLAFLAVAGGIALWRYQQTVD